MSYAPAAQYQEVAARSASPAQLVVMVYDHLLLNLRRARLAAEQQNVELRLASVDRARAALAELLATLDMERGGTVAAQLGSLYTFLLSELVELGSRPQPERHDRVIAMAAELREAFATIAAAPAAAAPADAREVA